MNPDKTALLESSLSGSIMFAINWLPKSVSRQESRLQKIFLVGKGLIIKFWQSEP